jgi:hypothetical protein
MFRSSLIVAGAALLCSTAAAQHRIDPARMVPVTGQLRNAGTVDITTGTWTAPNAQPKKAVQTVYNNTCTWTTTVYYAGYGECEDSYDEGAIPSTGRPGAPAGASDSQTMDSVQIYYCTFNATPVGGIDIELAFWDKLNGNCVGGIPPTPPNWATTATAYIPLAGIGLPGSTLNGNQACWIVTLDVSNSGWVMASDGEGTYDGIDDDDSFVWGKRFNNATPLIGAPNGFLITGEPASGTYGSCTYTIACGTDPNFGGATCGTGLDTWDGEWINVDGIASGSSAGTPAGCTSSVAAYGYGTGCYWFGGYPTNPFDSYWLVLTAEGGAGQAANFCTATPSSVTGCTSSLVADASVSKSAGAGSSTLSATPAPGGNQAGIFIYTRNGLLPSGGVLATFGWRCIATVVRGKPDLPGGSPNNCNGQYDWDLGGFVNTTPSILVGDTLHIQAWYRDPGSSAGALFTNGAGGITVTP